MMSREKIILIVILIILIVGGIVYFAVWPRVGEKEEVRVPKEKTLPEVLQDLTAPSSEASELSEETIKALTAPGKGAEVPEEVIKNLTAPE